MKVLISTHLHKIALVIVLLSSALLLTSCSAISGLFEQKATGPSETNYQVQFNAVNDFCSRALKLTVTDVQRRPLSVFAGASTSGGDDITSAATDSVLVQVDISYTWNSNTYRQMGMNYQGKELRLPSTLADLLQPGYLLYIEGEDADGEKYLVADVVSPQAQKDVNQLAINSQWDYDVLNSELPETSVTKTGSFLMRINSNAKNLQLVMYTPMSGQESTDKEMNQKGDVSKYVIPLT